MAKDRSSIEFSWFSNFLVRYRLPHWLVPCGQPNQTRWQREQSVQPRGRKRLLCSSEHRSHTLHIQAFLSSVEKIESVFDGASHQKVWDHFTKAQRKNIQTWKTLLVVSVNSRPVAFVVGLVRWNSRIGFLLYTVRLGLYRRVQNLW